MRALDYKLSCNNKNHYSIYLFKLWCNDSTRIIYQRNYRRDTFGLEWDHLGWDVFENTMAILIYRGIIIDLRSIYLVAYVYAHLYINIYLCVRVNSIVCINKRVEHIVVLSDATVVRGASPFVNSSLVIMLILNYLITFSIHLSFIKYTQ